MGEEIRLGKGEQPRSTQNEELLAEELEGQARPGWRKVFHQAFDRARRDQRNASRSEKGRDRSRSLFLLAGAAIGVLLLFLGVFSSPRTRQGPGPAQRRAPDLGRRVAPSRQMDAQAGSVTPLLDAGQEQPAAAGIQDVTPEDVRRTAHPARPQLPSMPGTVATPDTAGPGRYALGRIDFSDSSAPKEGFSVADSPREVASDDLKKPSLVFIRSSETAGPVPAAPPAPRESPVMQLLPVGTRLIARLESAVSSAVKAPVMAAIEYNYEEDGQIVVPAGARALGSLEQADPSGYVTIHFDVLRFPDGSQERIDAAAMSLNSEPLKGRVSGKRKATNFLVRAFSGIGQAATYLLGAGGFNEPLSESVLLRDRIATNIGIAGDQGLNNLAFRQNIIVTVPAGTRFYLVVQKSPAAGFEEASPHDSRELAGRQPPSPAELNQLMELRRELSQLYQQPGAQAAAPSDPQQ